MTSADSKISTVLAAGDRFITPAVFREHLDRRIGADITVRELEFPWPDVPFGSVAEVDEASGTEEELIDALRGCRAVVTQLAPLTEHVLHNSPELEIIGVSRGGPTNVNVDAATRRGIKVVNVPGRNGIATAEMTLGLILAVMRGIPTAHATLAAHEWHGEFYRHDRVGAEISGSTVGLIGAGAVGTQVAQVLAAMGAHVLIYDPYLPADRIPVGATVIDDLDEMFRRCILVSVHARLTDDTRNVVSDRRLGLMSRGGFLVNAARGGLVDYDAVADKLADGHLAGAGFDVFPTEPVDFGHRLFGLLDGGHNIVLTPHIAGASAQTAHRAAAGVAEEVRRHLLGIEPLHPLNSVLARRAAGEPV